MKTVLLWNPRVPVLAPVRLSLPDSVASALVRCGVATAADPGEQGALLAGGALEWSNLIEVAIEDGPLRKMRRVLMPDAAVSVAASLGIAAAVDGQAVGTAGLGALTLAASSIVENSEAGTVVGGILGATSGSTLTLTDSAGSRFAISGSNLVAGATPTDFETATSHDITIREAKEGYDDRDTVLTITVVNANEQPDLGALTLSATTFVIDTPASGSITGATAGSTITASGLPSGLTINGPARTWAWSGTGSVATGNITLTETLADSANSPRNSTVAFAVEEASAFPTNMRYSMNLDDFRYWCRARCFSNVLLAGSWGWASNNKTGVLSDTLLGRDGELIPGNALPADVTRAGLVYPVNTTMVLYWEGPSSGVTVENAGGSAVSGIGSIVASGSGYKREFTLNNSNWDALGGANWRARVAAATVGTNLPTRIFCCEKSLFDAHGGDIDAIPLWHTDYVSALAAEGIDDTLRFMDMMRINEAWAYDIDWSERAVVNAAACRPDQRAFVVFPASSANDADALNFAAQAWYAADTAYLANRITNNLSPVGGVPGPEGNQIAITLNTPSGSGNIVVTDGLANEVHIEITPPSGTSTAATIAAWWSSTSVGDAVTARGWVTIGGAPSGWANNTGASPIGAHGKTYLSGGRKGDAPDGMPLEWMLDLCSQLNKRPYFCLPYRATDDYSENFAATVAAKGLKPALYARGNEVVWNNGFNIARYVIGLAAANGRTTAQQRGLDHVAMMAAIRTGDPNAIRVLEAQNINPADMAAMLAVSGVPAAVDQGATAPYFADSGIIDDGTTDLDVIFGRIYAAIPAPITAAVTNRNNLQALGKTFITYEGGQHVVAYSGGKQTLMEAIERDPRMERATSIYFSELNRRVAEGAIGPLNFNYYLWTKALKGDGSGAFGMREHQGQADVDAPKARAFKRAKQGIFDAYLALDGSLAITTTAIYVGQEVAATIPTAYNAATTVIQWRADGTNISGATGTTYTPVSGDVGMVLDYTVTLTSSDGRSISYTSPATTAVNPVTKFKIIKAADISGGNITLPADWSNSNTVHCFGRGGQGVTSTGGGHYYNGGGGGAYAAGTVTGLSPSASVPVSIGTAASAIATSFNSGAVSADYGRNGADSASSFGAGGLAANSTGSVKYSGGDDGASTTTFFSTAAGGGCAGPNGAGGKGGDATGGPASGGGGANGGGAGVLGSGVGGRGGHNRFGTGGGQGGSTAGGAAQNGTNGGGGGGGGETQGVGASGVMEILFTDTLSGSQIGPSGGAGGGTSGATRTPGNASYGGGGGGSGAAASVSGEGFIVLEWQPA